MRHHFLLVSNMATSCIPTCDKPKCRKGLPCSKCARTGLVKLSVMVMEYESTVKELQAAYAHIEDFLCETGVDEPEQRLAPEHDWEPLFREPMDPTEIDTLPYDDSDWSAMTSDGTSEKPYLL